MDRTRTQLEQGNYEFEQWTHQLQASNHQSIKCGSSKSPKLQSARLDQIRKIRVPGSGCHQGEASQGPMSSQSDHLCAFDSVCIHVGGHIYRTSPQMMVTSWYMTGTGQSALGLDLPNHWQNSNPHNFPTFSPIGPSGVRMFKLKFEHPFHLST